METEEKIGNMLAKNKGITLVALIVTIIVLIILATIGIRGILGENGMIKSSQKTRREQEGLTENTEERMNQLTSKYQNILYGNTDVQYIPDIMEPEEASIILSRQIANTGEIVTAAVTHEDYESGIAPNECKWIYDQSSADIHVESEVWDTGNRFQTNPETINLVANIPGEYYLHVLSVDKQGNATQITVGPVTIRQGVTGVTVNPPAVAFNKIGATQQLTATVSPADAYNKAVTWNSSNPNVATVDTNGLVTFKGAGTATITVTTVDGNKTATCRVTTILVTGVTVSPTEVPLTGVNATKQLTATVSPSNAFNKAVTWSSSNENVATVNSSSGLVTAKGTGTATITVRTADGGKTASCKVTVTIPVTGVAVSPTAVTLKEMNGTQQLIATVSPSNASNKDVSWSSNNPSVATVDSKSGLVTAKGEGTAIITVKTADGNKTATCTVKVNFWTVGPNSSEGSVTFARPASTSNPTVIRIADSATQGVAARVTYNKPIAVGDKIEIIYSYTRSKNDYYLDLLVEPWKSIRLNSGTTSTQTLTFTAEKAHNLMTIALYRSNCPSAGYYGTVNIYSVKLNGTKIL